MKPFEDHDWNGFAGATDAPGKPPLIGVREFGDNTGIVIVVDVNGIDVYDTKNQQLLDGEEVNYYKYCSYETAKILAELLEGETIDREHLSTFLREIGCN